MAIIIYPKAPTPLTSLQQKTMIKPNSLSSKGIVFLLIVLFSFGHLQAQEEQLSDSLPSWKHERKLGVLLNQSSFNNWLAGGTNNFSGTFNLDYVLAYTGKEWSWSTTIDAALGYAKTQGNNEWIKTEDQLEINAILQRKTENAWNFSSSFNLKTQNAPAFIYAETENAIVKTKSSSFFSPAYLRLGIGIAYDKGDRFSLQFNPLSARLIVVDRTFTEALSLDETFFGVAVDKTTRWEAGASFALQSKVELAKNVSLANRLSLITNYLEEFNNVDFDYIGTFNMKVNEYLSALFEIQLLYDDNALADLQTRQVFGLVIALPF